MDYNKIKQSTSLKNLIESYGITLHGNYPQLKGLCPFHNDTNESLSVNAALGKWNCFGCGQFGDVFDFIKLKENCSLKEAINILLPEMKVLSTAIINQPKSINDTHFENTFQIFELCVDYFQEQLTKGIIDKYLLNGENFTFFIYENNKRTLKEFIPYGFIEDQIKDYRIGFAPSDIKDLLNILNFKGYKKEEIASTGLFVLTKQGKLQSYYKNRIIFPYLDEYGQVIYSIARSTEWTPTNKFEPKYKKQLTSQSKPYVSTQINNSHIFMDYVAENNDTFLITEGVTDCIAANMKGIPCISPATVRFKESDKAKLECLANGKRVVICNDNENNKSGERGAYDTAKYLMENGVYVTIVTLPKPENKEKIDLCEYLKTHNREDFCKLIYAN